MNTTSITEIITCIDCKESFEQEFKIKSGSEATTSKANADCPHCDTINYFEINGELVPDQTLFRGK